MLVRKTRPAPEFSQAICHAGLSHSKQLWKNIRPVMLASFGRPLMKRYSHWQNDWLYAPVYVGTGWLIVSYKEERRSDSARAHHLRLSLFISWPTVAVPSLPLCLEWDNGSYFTPDNGDRQQHCQEHVCIFIFVRWCSLNRTFVSQRVCDSSRSPTSAYSELRPVIPVQTL